MFTTNALTVIGGTIIDYAVGDPPQLPHPVVAFGKAISFLESHLNRAGSHPVWLRLSGSLTVVLVLGLAFGIPYFLLRALTPFPWLFWVLNCWLMSTTIAAKGLQQAGIVIYKLLGESDLTRARLEVGKIVGRDTADLSVAEIIRATVESLAENTVDGIIAPLCFGFLGGAPLAMLYRAINTLDSMIGYKNERYRYFGWAAARIDDLANLIPARIGALLMVVSATILRLNWQGSLWMIRRDAKKHPSPNGGWPEAAVAGALGIRLGGLNYYQGIASFRNYLGDSVKILESEDILKAARLLKITVLLAILVSISLVFIPGF